MPLDLNMFIVEGRIHGDIEDRHTPKGLAIVKFMIVNRGGYQDKEGKTVTKEPDRLEITLFGRRGEGMVSNLGEGDFIRATGYMRYSEYEKKMNIVAQSVIALDYPQPPAEKFTPAPTHKPSTPPPDVPMSHTPPTDDDLPF